MPPITGSSLQALAPRGGPVWPSVATLTDPAHDPAIAGFKGPVKEIYCCQTEQNTSAFCVYARASVDCAEYSDVEGVLVYEGTNATLCGVYVRDDEVLATFTDL